MRECRRVFTITLVIFALITTMMSNVAMAAYQPYTTSGNFGNNLYWSFSEYDGVLTISGQGAMPDCTYSHDREKNVYISKSPWRMHDGKVRKIVISDGITRVGAYSFSYFPRLTNVTLADSVKEIGEYAFGDCFMLSEIDIGSGMQIIDSRSFAYTNLRTINYSGTEETWNAIEKVKGWHVEVPESQIKVRYSEWKFNQNTGALTVAVSGDSFKNTVPWKMYNKNIKSVTFLEGVTSIGDNWFSECSNLTTVQLPNSLKEIGDGAFANCESLTIVSLPDGLQEIGYAAFRSTGIKYVTIPDSVTTISGYAFADCKSLSGVQFPKGIQKINEGVFSDCKSIKELTLPDTLKEIDKYAFSSTGISKLTIPAAVTTIGANAFSGCSSLETLEIGSGVKTLGDYCFSDCKLRKVYYKGTISQWEQIKKSNTWNNGDSKGKMSFNYMKNGVMTDYGSYDPNIINVIVDGNYINFDTKPQFVNGRTMVPMRRIFEELGATVQWDNATWTAIAKKGGTEIRFTIDDYTMYKNGSPNTLDVPAQLIDGRTLVPLRAVSEAFGCDVGWDGTDNVVSIISDSQNYTMLYSQDGRSRCYAKADANGISGWYNEPSVLLYSCEKGQYFLQSQAEAQLRAGWSYTRGHNWRAATCTSPKTCTKCGATSGGTTAHSFNKKTGKCDYCSTSMSDGGGMSAYPG